MGVVFIIAPFAFHFTGLTLGTTVLAASVLLTTSIFNAPEVGAASERTSARERQ